MDPRFARLTLGLIEEGRLERDFNQEFAAVQAVLIAHLEKWGEAAKKSKASITLKIDIACENHEDGVFSVKAKISKVLPGRPARTTTGIAIEENGVHSLFARRSGSTRTTPRQQVLCTEDGRAVDQETGEISEEVQP